ncbi:MAG: phosphoribosylanthranilate isomerase [Phaeodactylibacter sp.]|nr:phosphoribosylanthranilate isomerase [Phaeodactylibacter sp.]
MKIKVCGMREPENLRGLAKLPVDMVGFIFYPRSPRYAGEKVAKWLSKQGYLLEGKKRVGVFVNAEVEDVLNHVHDFELDFVQLHGNESPEYCQLLRDLWESTSMRKAKLIKAFGINDAFDFDEAAAFTPHCAYFLFDTKGKEFGGTGQQFDWRLLDRYQGVTPFLLSGGIGPESAPAILGIRHPQLYGVDINSRFEEQPGVKGLDKVARFITDLKGHAS